LHLQIEILDAKTDAIEAKLAEKVDVVAGHTARVNLNRDLGCVAQGKAIVKLRPEEFNLLFVQIVGRTAAPVELHDLALGIDLIRNPVDVLHQMLQIGFDDFAALGDQRIATAEIAGAFAKGMWQ